MKIGVLYTKYVVIKGTDIGKFLSEKEMYLLHDLSTKISDGRKAEGKEDNEYVVLNLGDDIDLSPWSPILKRIEEIEKTHIIPIKFGKNGETYGHDCRPDKVRDIAVAFVNAILNKSPMVE